MHEVVKRTRCNSAKKTNEHIGNWGKGQWRGEKWERKNVLKEGGSSVTVIKEKKNIKI